jgi:hypothetical protein
MDIETKKYLLVRNELETKTLKKIDELIEKVKALPENVKDRAEDIQRLIVIDDELDDLLLNWSDSGFGTRSFDQGFGFDDLEDD